MGDAGWAALIAGAAWLGGIAFGLRLGWGLCVRRAAEEWEEDDDGEDVAEAVRDVSVAASLPGPPPPGCAVPEWWELERDDQYAHLVDPERYRMVAEQVELWSERVSRGEPPAPRK